VIAVVGVPPAVFHVQLVGPPVEASVKIIGAPVQPMLCELIAAVGVVAAIPLIFI